MSNIESNTTLFLIVGIIVLICCSCISGGIGYYIYSKPNTTSSSVSTTSTTTESPSIFTRLTNVFTPTPAPVAVTPGKIGNPCLADGTCTDANSICKFNMCYEQCKGRNAWPCENDGDIPQIKTYWCDYSSCPAAVAPSKTTVTTEKQPSAFDTAVKQMAAADALKAETQAKQEAVAQEAAAAAQAQALADANDQLIQCKCVVNPLDSRHKTMACFNGTFNGDGSDSQMWCNTNGGTKCKTATVSKYDAGRAWRLCDASTQN